MWRYRKRYRMMPDMYRSYLESDVKALDKDSVIRDLNKVYFENRGFLTDYHLMQNELFEDRRSRTDRISGKATGYFRQISGGKDIIFKSSYTSGRRYQKSWKI